MKAGFFRTHLYVMLAIALTGLGGCGGGNNEPAILVSTATPTSASIPTLTPTAAPTATPAPATTSTPTTTSTPARTATVIPTSTATPTATPTPIPTQTPTASPTARPTPRPTTGTPTASPASTPAPNACVPSSSLGVLVSGANVDAYEPNGSWTLGGRGVQLVPIEGTDSRATITTPNEVNSCSGNSATGTTVCMANNTDTYIINGSTLTATLTSGAETPATFSGGSCQNCGVVVDSTTDAAILGMGLGTAGHFGSGYQTLDLATNTFDTPIPSGLPGAVFPGTSGGFISEDISVDPGRHLILSPSEDGTYEIVRTQPSISVFENNIPNGPEFDSAAEDCTTGIALSTIESGGGSLFIADLTQATFITGSPGTWTAPSQVQFFHDFDAMLNGTCGIAVAPGTHLGIVIGEGGESEFAPDNLIGAIQLPSTSGSGKPAVVDFVAATMPNEPDGTGIDTGDPHPVTAYVSPSSKRAFALIGDGHIPRGFIAVVDLQGLLSAPRTVGTHTVDPSFGLIKSGVVRYVSVH